MSSLRTQGPIPRDLSTRPCGRYLSQNVRRWLWVPAFAGTTASVLRAHSNFKQPSPERVIQNLGWVERSDTHQPRRTRCSMGFASLYPSYKKTRLRILAARSARRDAIGDALEKPTGRRESRVPSAPAVVRTSMHTADYKCAGTPGFPCAMVLTA